MIIAYYRNKDGKIYSCNKVTDVPMDEIAKKEEVFNERSRPDTTVTIVEVDDDSLEAYLLEKAEAKYKVLQSAKNDAISALQDAIACIEELEVADG